MKIYEVYHWTSGSKSPQIPEELRGPYPLEIPPEKLIELTEKFDVMLVRRTPEGHRDGAGNECPFGMPRKGYTPPKVCMSCGQETAPVDELSIFLDDRKGRFRQR